MLRCDVMCHMRVTIMSVDADDALSLIRLSRPQINPNPGFLQRLNSFANNEGGVLEVGTRRLRFHAAENT